MYNLEARTLEQSKQPTYVTNVTYVTYVNYVTYAMWPMLSFVKTWQGHHIFWPPHSEVKSRSLRQHSREFVF